MMTIMTDRPPNTPTLTGPAEGEPGTFYIYTLTTIDPDGDMVYYYIDWGDRQIRNGSAPTTQVRPPQRLTSGLKKEPTPSRQKQKTAYGVESGWATLEVTMPVSIEKHQATPLDVFFQQINVFFESLGLRLFRR